MTPQVSVIIPIKDERENLRPLWADLAAAMGPTGRPFEAVFVDDGSSDGSDAVLAELARADSRVRVVRLRRNFGQSAALKAGIDWSRGDVIVTIDGDRQNDPADVPLLVAKLDEGYDAVLGLRAQRQDGLWLRKVPSWLGNWVIRRATGVHFKDFGCTQRAMRRDLAVSLPLYGEMHRFISVLAQQYGARMTQVPVRHHPRTAGRSKYNLSRTVRVVLDLITVQFLHGYLTRPMHVFGLGGLVCMALGGVSFAATVIMKLVSGLWMTGNPVLHLGVLLEVIGVQFISLGLLGEVLTRIYFESQGKPAYTVREVLNPPGDGEQRRAA
jgi:glycosyltransferase involved in cell wall biosynthesis